MTRFWIVSVTAAAMIALAARWAPLEVGGAGDGCPGGGTCVAEFTAPKGSGGPDWFYGGEGVDRTRGDDDRPNTQGDPRIEYEFRCDPGRDEAPTGAGEELPRGCEDVRARFY
jgi:hypothetical protein